MKKMANVQTWGLIRVTGTDGKIKFIKASSWIKVKEEDIQSDELG